MTPQQLIGTGVRLFSIWLALSSIAYFAAVPTALSAAPFGDGTSTTVSYAVGGLYVLVAVILWLFPMSVAHKLLPRTSHTNTLALPGSGLARTGVGLLGLWLVAKALPSVVWVLFRAYLYVEAGSSFSALTPELKLEVSVSTFEVLLGVFIIMQSAALARAILATAPAATPSSDDE